MARTHKAKRAYDDKLAQLQFKIRVLKAAEEYVTTEHHAKTPNEKLALKSRVAESHGVRSYDITQVLLP